MNFDYRGFWDDYAEKFANRVRKKLFPANYLKYRELWAEQFFALPNAQKAQAVLTARILLRSLIRQHQRVSAPSLLTLNLLEPNPVKFCLDDLLDLLSTAASEMPDSIARMCNSCSDDEADVYTLDYLQSVAEIIQLSDEDMPQYFGHVEDLPVTGCIPFVLPRKP